MKPFLDQIFLFPSKFRFLPLYLLKPMFFVGYRFGCSIFTTKTLAIHERKFFSRNNFFGGLRKNWIHWLNHGIQFIFRFVVRWTNFYTRTYLIEIKNKFEKRETNFSYPKFFPLVVVGKKLENIKLDNFFFSCFAFSIY